VGKGRKALPRVRMIPGEAHRDRILSLSDEKAYFEATQAIGLSTLEMYQRALDGRQDGQCAPRIPLSQRAASILEMRRSRETGPWIFSAPTRSGHIEPSSLQGQHAKACTLGKVVHFPLYTFRHTCLTRWAPFMDPWTSLLGWPSGHVNHEAIRASPGIQHASGD
jgi:hypothetical protein